LKEDLMTDLTSEKEAAEYAVTMNRFFDYQAATVVKASGPELLSQDAYGILIRFPDGRMPVVALGKHGALYWIGRISEEHYYVMKERGII
jgi:hypothetical protein